MLKAFNFNEIIGGINVLKPLGDRVILQAAEEEEQTVGGIVLASNAQEKPTTGKVISVGEGRVLDNGTKVAPSVKEGDTVMFDKYAGTAVSYEGNDYLVLHEKDIVAVVD
ncbi:chaperone GroES [Furfurilactobacillus rossiae DSM 15814]|uniref:Co-chaperonin GroES n=1 Tax=Furfurilactobacillus rossiae DSM 15814 TaxID=1114972 RepID=A0A0R1RIG5_9LACO|nr:chaperone GroES [Furfurilactobacillus rossiae DSM 15814]